jgi:hypothetical protein
MSTEIVVERKPGRSKKNSDSTADDILPYVILIQETAQWILEQNSDDEFTLRFC